MVNYLRRRALGTLAHFLLTWILHLGISFLKVEESANWPPQNEPSLKYQILTKELK